MMLEQHTHVSKPKFIKRHVSSNLSRVLVRFDHVASFVVTANHSIVRPAVTLRVVDCGEWQRIENQIKAAVIFTGSDFVNVMEAQIESGVVARMMSSRSLAKPSRSQI